MDEVLSQEEINALLLAMQEHETPASEEVALPKRSLIGRVVEYDFARPNKLSKEQLRVLALMHESFARGIGLTLSAYLRTLVDAEVVSAELTAYEVLIRSFSNPGIVSVFSLHPFEGNVLLEIHPDLGFAMIDRLLGGSGKTPKQVRELTDIEQPVMRRVVERIMANLVEAWQHLAPIDPRFERSEFHPQFSQIAAPKDMVVVITIAVALKGVIGNLKLVIPYFVIEPVVPNLTHNLIVRDKKDVSEAEEQALRENIRHMEVPVTALLGRAEVHIKDLLDLQVGDYISLNTKVTDPLPILIGHIEKLLGRPGRIGNRLAIEVVATTPKNDM